MQKWESKAQLGDARMLRWFQHQEDRAQESAAAALCRYGLVCVCLLFGTNRLNAFSTCTKSVVLDCVVAGKNHTYSMLLVDFY